MDELFVKVFRQKAMLTASDLAICDQYFESVSAEKHTTLEGERKVPKHLYFLLSGYCRLFYTDDHGEEVTTHISGPGEFITSFLGFINNMPAKDQLECVTDCSLLRIKREDLEQLITSSETFKAFSLLIFQEAISSSVQRADELATADAEMRYRRLMDTRPDLIQHVPIQYIASFLGIKAPSLSRIRRKIKS